MRCEPMKIETARFATVEISDKAVINFPKGIAPFGSDLDFVIIAPEAEGPTAWLQSCDIPELAFWVGQLVRLFPEYDLDLDSAYIREMEVMSETELSILTMLSVFEHEITANLLAPLMINRSLRRGRQVVIPGSTELVRVPVSLEKMQPQTVQ